jgi:hypothetical protein
MEPTNQIVLVLTELQRYTLGSNFHEENIAVWKSDGIDVHVHLMQQAVDIALGDQRGLVVPAGVRVTVDPFSLSVRGADPAKLPDSIETLDMDGLIVALSATASRCIWY